MAAVGALQLPKRSGFGRRLAAVSKEAAVRVAPQPLHNCQAAPGPLRTIPWTRHREWFRCCQAITTGEGASGPAPCQEGAPLGQQSIQQPATADADEVTTTADGFQHIEGNLLRSNSDEGSLGSLSEDLPVDEWEFGSEMESLLGNGDDADDDYDDLDDFADDEDDFDEEDEHRERQPMPEAQKASLTVEELLAQGLHPVDGLAQLLRLFPFQLDKFQLTSVDHILKGRSVVVCAPTGAGKTCIAEASAAAALAKGKRVIYTTPLKALSNQKLAEMREKFGEQRVGLQTGDASLNTEGDLVVMTTEILRNIMYRTAVENNPDLSPLASVGLIVLDEVHYLGDPNRGSVWEEVIINCPKHIQMLCMSATVQNPRDLGGWIQQVHGPCETVITKFRPIPLKWAFAYKTYDGDAAILPLMDRRQKSLNNDILTEMRGKSGWRSSRGQGRQLGAIGVIDTVVEMNRRSMLPAIIFIFSRQDCDAAVRSMCTAGLNLASDAERTGIEELVDDLRRNQPEAVRENAVKGLLRGIASHHAGMLPAWKKLVETAFQRGFLKAIFATETLAAGINMPARSTVISVMSRRRGSAHALLTHNELLQMAGRAGRRGYDDVGHVVIVQSRWDGCQEAFDVLQRGPEALSSQFSTSYGMVLNLLATKSMEEARSFVERSFGNYLGGEGVKRKMLEIEDMERRAQILLESVKASVQPAGASDPVVLKYAELQGEVKQIRRRLRRLRKAARGERGLLAMERVEVGVGLPCVVGLDLPESDTIWTANIGEDYEPELLTALLLRRLQDEEVEGMGLEVDPGLPVYLGLGADNRILAVASHYVAAVGARSGFSGGAGGSDTSAFDVGNVAWSRLGGYVAGNGSIHTAAMALELSNQQESSFQPVLLDPAMLEETGRQLQALKEARNAASKLKKHPSMRTARKQQARSPRQQESLSFQEEGAEKLMRSAERMRASMQRRLTAGWVSFEEMVSILADFGALTRDELKLLPLGMVARELRGDNELWLAACITHPGVQYLAPAPLAGLLSSLVAAEMMGTRPNLHVAYPPSKAVLDAANQLEEVQEQLRQLQMATTSINCKLAVDLRFAGLVEAWVSGISWYQLTSDTSLDEGDVARLLGRTADLMRQITFVSDLLPGIQAAAREGLKTMIRSPISDLVS